MFFKKINTFIERLEQIKMSFWQLILVFVTSIYLRTFIENFTNSNNQGFLNSFPDTFFHYPLWYACVFLSEILIIYLLTKYEIKKIATVVAVFSFGLLLPPIIDFFVYGLVGHTYNFIADSYSLLGKHFLNIMFTTDAISLGIKIEVIAAILGAAIYVGTKSKSKKILKAVFGGILVYFSIFFFLTLPVHTMKIYNVFTPQTEQSIDQQSVVDFYFIDEPISSQKSLLFFSAPPGFSGDTEVQNRFSVSMSIVLLLFTGFLLGCIYYKTEPKKYLAVIKNTRPIRILSFSGMACLGMVAGVMANKTTGFVGSLSDSLSIVALFIAVISAWLFAVWENDEADREIDQISSSWRPLVTGAFNAEEWKTIKHIFLFFALGASWLAGIYVFTFIVLFILTYHMYSMPPLRLKRFPVVSSVLVAMNAIFIGMAGFFVTAQTYNLTDLPLRYILYVFIVYVLTENFKNVKDIEGDRAGNIYTLPVLFGKKRGVQLTAALTIIGVLLVPVFFHWSVLTAITAGMFSILFWLAINHKRYKEWRVTALFVAFIAIFIIQMFLLS